jgi:hypothetical protein
VTDIEPDVVWKVVLIDAIGVEFTEALNKASSRVLMVGTASVDRRPGAEDSEDLEDDVEVVCPEVETTPLVSRSSTRSFLFDSASLCRKTCAVMDPLDCQLTFRWMFEKTYSETLTSRLSEILKVPATSL